jgi:NAD(P)-dependent dehydrogenase (short-subunit alcohol dehydrogenase family)
MSELNGKVALVTGGGGIIGRGVCKVLAQAGARVVVSGRNLASVDETVKMIIDTGGEAIAVKLDVTCEADWQKAIDLTLTHFKKLNILVNNAGGVEGVNGCEGVSLSDWNNVLNINLTGAFLGVRSGVAAMKDNKEFNSIINIASLSGMMPDMRVPYSVSKAGVLMLGKCVAMECRKKGYDNIRVNTILPGGVIADTDPEPKGTAEFDRYHPPARFGRVKDVAKGVLFLASEDSSFMSGSELIIDGGYSASIFGFTTENIIEELREANQ